MSAQILAFPVMAERRALSRRPTPGGGPNMHTLIFRSYALIVASDSHDLARDVAFDVDKARKKLRRVLDQIERDRAHQAAREELMTTAARKLAAAIEAVCLD